MLRYTIAKLMLLFIFVIVNPIYAAPIYDAKGATSYANAWWGSSLPNEEKWQIYNTWLNTDTGKDINRGQRYTNPYFNHYMRETSYGWMTDCAHFVSQCLIAGGLGEGIRTFVRRISNTSAVQNTNETLQNYGGLIFEKINNEHDPSNGYISDGGSLLIL